MTVEQYILFCTAIEIRQNRDKLDCHVNPIPRIYCKDGVDLSVQIHPYAHCGFEGSTFNIMGFPYPDKFGTKVLDAETDCEELDKYGMDDIADIESYVEKHGGIDIDKTISVFVEDVAENSHR